MVVGLLAGTFLLSIMASPQAVRIGSFADVRNNMVRVLNRRVTYYKDIDPLPYTRLKVGYFKKILKFCYYYRAQLPGFSIIYLRWAVRDVIENICREWYNGLLFIGPTNDPMVGFDHRAIFDVDSFDELLYNLGIMYIIYMGFSEKLEEGHQLCEAQKSLGSAVDPSMAIQEAESDERPNYDNKHRLLIEVWAAIEKLPTTNLSGIKEKLSEFVLEREYSPISKELNHISATSHSREEIISNLRCMASAYASMCG